MGREPGIGPAQLTCPNTDTDRSDQSVPVLFAPLFLEAGAGHNRAVSTATVSSFLNAAGSSVKASMRGRCVKASMRGRCFLAGQVMVVRDGLSAW